MRLLADHGALFLGQGVSYPGHAMYHDLEGVPAEQRIEFPVAEELQLGASIGLAMTDQLVVSIFPRMDFLLRAMDQLVNHLDKMEEMTCGQWQPKVIIRTRIGSRTPLHAGPQHTQNHIEAFRKMLTNVHVFHVTNDDEVLEVYRFALNQPKSTIVVEDFG